MIDRETGGHTMAYPRNKMTMDEAINIAKKNGYKIQGKANIWLDDKGCRF